MFDGSINIINCVLMMERIFDLQQEIPSNIHSDPSP